jgi:hypothetical protein
MTSYRIDIAYKGTTEYIINVDGDDRLICTVSNPDGDAIDWAEIRNDDHESPLELIERVLHALNA